MSESLPDGTAVANASSFDLLDKSGKKVNFGSLFKEKKIIVVFIHAEISVLLQQAELEQKSENCSSVASGRT
ncbi:hypothetical protein D9757_012581 [Collybiopsis confluens]|uniref:Uncharacterized protein n=1 Tax=Collybiopsis confluens TaxID=2823264 RepID=A0A8H5D230_9AGAR|nr:hypothetical protein D9757_012581 [Collybiopsis confluens]